MFTGLVQAVGTVRERAGARLRVAAPASFVPEGFDLGESVAVNGVCLTVVSEAGGIAFDVSEETGRRTALGDLQKGDPVNLERAVTPSTRLGGHFVQGHVDAVGRLVEVREEANSAVYVWQAPPEYDRYLVDKGSVAVDGISLTVVHPKEGRFETWIIPHTRAETNLKAKPPGAPANLEFDVLAKYVERLVSKP